MLQLVWVMCIFLIPVNIYYLNHFKRGVKLQLNQTTQLHIKGMFSYILLTLIIFASFSACSNWQRSRPEGTAYDSNQQSSSQLKPVEIMDIIFGKDIPEVLKGCGLANKALKAARQSLDKLVIDCHQQSPIADQGKK